MLPKEPKSRLKSLLKKSLGAILVVETVGIGLTYLFWNRLNKERDFRYYMLQSYPYILEGFYSIGETANSEYQTRQLDQTIWKQEGKIQ